MPNHVQNIVRLQGDEKSVKEVLEAVKNDRYGIGSVDFEKIIPMPPPLRMECSARTERGCKAYLEFLKSGAESEKAYLAQRPTIPPEEWALGKQACENIREFGAPTWYEWSIAHWGTKWNAYNEDPTRKNPDALRFQTAWEAPHPILKRLSEMYPGITFEHVWADEDIGENCGRKRLLNGETVLLASGRPNAYLAERNEEAEAMFFRLIKELAKNEGVTEKRKAEDGMKWVKAMNHIRHRAAEVVYNDLIYN